MAGRVAYNGGIVANGLTLSIDASKRASYPGTGTTVFDTSPASTNCTLSTPGILDTPLPPHFNQTVTIPSVTTTRGLGQSGTIDLWFQNKVDRPVNGNGGAQSVLFGAFNTSFWLYRNDFFTTNGYSIVSYYIGTPGNIVNASVYTPNVWYNVVVTLTSNGQYAYYRNGTTLASGTAAGFTSWRGFSSSYTIGNGLGTGNMGVANVKMYNRFLTQAEVLQNYNAVKARFGL
jgi:hypothetical protein